MNKIHTCKRESNCQYLRQEYKETYNKHIYIIKEIHICTKISESISKEYETENRVDVELPFEEMTLRNSIQLAFRYHLERDVFLKRAWIRIL